MFAGPTARGLQAGPTAGAISTNPAAYIPDDGLTIAQINELRGEGGHEIGHLALAQAPLGYGRLLAREAAGEIRLQRSGGKVAGETGHSALTQPPRGMVGSRVAMASDSCCAVARAAKSLANPVTRAWGSVAVAVTSGCFPARPAATCSVVARDAKSLGRLVTRAWGSVALALMRGCFCANSPRSSLIWAIVSPSSGM